MPIFFFDVQCDGVGETDQVGTELAGTTPIPDLALKLALEIAREAVPLLRTVVVSVRDGRPLPVFSATLSLVGDWRQ
jgi:hypothetical protein